MKVHASALKHGVEPDDAVRAASTGFDGSGRLLELVVLRFDSGNELIIHAMKARR